MECSDDEAGLEMAFRLPYKSTVAFSLSAFFRPQQHLRLMDISGDVIAEIVLKQFDALPAKTKPLVRGGGVREWVPLSGIVAQGDP
jgi:hypothetical protein